MKIPEILKSYYKYELYFANKAIENNRDPSNKGIEELLSPSNIIQAFLDTDMETLLNYIIEIPHSKISSWNIPQFSNFKDGTYTNIHTLRLMGDYGPDFQMVGKYMLGMGKKKYAYIKYGENHSKLSTILDLCYITRTRKSVVYLTELGKEAERMKESKFEDFIIKKTITIPVIHKILFDANFGEVNIKKVLRNYLSESTVKRRSSNIRYILREIQNCYSGDRYNNIFNNIKG